MNLMLNSTYVLGDDPNQTGMNTTGKFLLTAVGSAPTNSCMCTAIVYMITAPPPLRGVDGPVEQQVGIDQYRYSNGHGARRSESEIDGCAEYNSRPLS